MNYNINVGKDFRNQFLGKVAHIYELAVTQKRHNQNEL